MKDNIKQGGHDQQGGQPDINEKNLGQHDQQGGKQWEDMRKTVEK